VVLYLPHLAERRQQLVEMAAPAGRVTYDLSGSGRSLSSQLDYIASAMSFRSATLQAARSASLGTAGDTFMAIIHGNQGTADMGTIQYSSIARLEGGDHLPMLHFKDTTTTRC
jgi:hypothetical protein